jgi:hypothetical protein
VGIVAHVGQIGRTLEEQERAFEHGRSGTMNSKHLKAQAVDIYPFDRDAGELDLEGQNIELYRKMHEVAKALGWRSIAFNPDGSRHLVTAGNGKKFWDGAHLEWTPNTQ